MGWNHQPYTAKFSYALLLLETTMTGFAGFHRLDTAGGLRGGARNWDQHRSAYSCFLIHIIHLWCEYSIVSSYSVMTISKKWPLSFLDMERSCHSCNRYDQGYDALVPAGQSKNPTWLGHKITWKVLKLKKSNGFSKHFEDHFPTFPTLVTLVLIGKTIWLAEGLKLEQTIPSSIHVLIPRGSRSSPPGCYPPCLQGLASSVSFNAGITALERGSRWTLALQLLQVPWSQVGILWQIIYVCMYIYIYFIIYIYI